MRSAGAHSEISRLVRRTRAHRERAARRRRQVIALGAGACLSLGLGTAFSVASFAGGNLAEAAVTRAKSLMDLMEQRSPGERTAGELTKTKNKLLADRDAPEIAPAVPKSLAEVIAPPAPMPEPVNIIAPPAELVSPSPPGEVLLPPPGGVPPPGGPPPCCGGVNPPPNSPPPPNNPPPPHTPPPPALPEPGTWMTMILGFGLAGWSIRRGNAATQPLRAARQP